MTQIKTNEIEASLIIYGDSINKNIKKLLDLENIGNYYLSPQSSYTIHDSYFDTNNDDLLKGGFGLRVRNINSQDKITLKGKSKRTDWGGVKRLEIEHDWEKQSWNTVISYLKENIPNLKIEDHFDSSLNAINMLLKNGLRIIQERNNNRITRFVCTDQNCKIQIAELAVDSLGFIIRDSEIFSYEIEIELKQNENVKVLKSLMDELQTIVKPETQVWEFSKLGTGRVIQRLWDQGILQSTLDENNRLTQLSYDIIRECRLSRKINKKM